MEKWGETDEREIVDISVDDTVEVVGGIMLRYFNC